MTTDSRASSVWPLFLSILACMLAAVALVVALSNRPEQARPPQANAGKNNPPVPPPVGAIEKEKPSAPVPVSALPGKAIQDYDLSTPQSAIRSQMEIEALADIRASLEYQRMQKLLDKDVALRSLSTLQFDRTIEHDGKVLVLYHYEEGGIPRHKTAWVQKREGRYFHTWVNTWEWAQDKGDKGQIHKLITEWEAKDRPPLSVLPQPPVAPQTAPKSSPPDEKALALQRAFTAFDEANALSVAGKFSEGATMYAFAARAAIEAGQTELAQEDYYNAVLSCLKAQDNDLAFKYAVSAGTLEGYLTEKARVLAESLWEIPEDSVQAALRERKDTQQRVSAANARQPIPKPTPKPTRGDLPWKQSK